jgi:PPOX class probable F420-dependent enzyme
VVPFVFAIDERKIVSAVDHKPKRSPGLRRLRDIAANPAVSVLIDHYEEDWNRLWWVRADGLGSIVSEGSAYRDAVAALVAKYDHYRKRPVGGDKRVSSLIAATPCQTGSRQRHSLVFCGPADDPKPKANSYPLTE